MDKLSHLFAGMAIAASLYPFGSILAMGVVAVAAIGKEVWDSQGNGTPDVKDALATLAGGVLMLFWFGTVL